ncbi:MAG: hypothetical protein UR94_C0026G0008 [Parcubacteria group bacterium GW2011_GWA2_36_10]|nr:MAG: hypothetical protein UR94_C0026G0008 [Parcubacteria group bacterium GW2011_GWA2_36_10]
MSLSLNQGTSPDGLRAKTHGFKNEHGQNVLTLGEYEITFEDFLALAHYVLTNTNLEPDDIRLHFVECVRSAQVTEGYREEIGGHVQDTKRLSIDMPQLPPHP